MQLLILTTNKKTLEWKSLKTKLAAIEGALNSAKNANWKVSIQYVDTVPEVNKEGRIVHKWLTNLITPYFNKGFDVIGLHMAMAERDAWGVTNTLRGANPRTKGEIGDYWFWADENTKRSGAKNNQFIQTCLHEFAHEYYQQTGITDETHAYHDKHGDITGLFKKFDFAKYQPVRQNLKKQVSILNQIVNILKSVIGINKTPQVIEPTPVVVPDTSNPTQLLPLVQRKADEIVKEMAKKGHAVRVTAGYRSMEEQQKLYNQGRTTPGAIVTQAKPGESLHNYGVAVDFVFRKEGFNASDTLWATLGDIGKKQGFSWGGDWTGFVDRPHFEMLLGHKLADFQKNKVDYTKYL